MSTSTEKELERLVAKVRRLPQDRQELAVTALSEIADDVYELSEDELAALRPTVQDAQLGDNIQDLNDVDVLNNP